MLFLNRRGYAGFVSCRSCGHVMKCPHCDVSLSEHRGGRLICHYCGYQGQSPRAVPACGSPYIGGFQAGTQQIEQVLLREFPGVRVLRMDYDTTRNKGSYERSWRPSAPMRQTFWWGTQMIVKGHDFPKVTLVGGACSGSVSERFRLPERRADVSASYAGGGKSGARHRSGQAIIQTYHPEHYSIAAAASQDYKAFYQEEMGYRELLSYPPAAGMLAVLGSCGEEELLGRAMHYLKLFAEKISRGKPLTIITGAGSGGKGAGHLPPGALPEIRKYRNSDSDKR